jgi:TldD protein
VGVRALVRGAWGFAATCSEDASALRAVCDRAVEVARATAIVSPERVRLSPVEAHSGSYTSPCAEDPFEVPIGERVDLLKGAVEALRINDAIRGAEGFIEATREEKRFLSTEGADLTQTFTYSGSGLTATAVRGDEVQRRSYPADTMGYHTAAGFEAIRALKLIERAPGVAEEAMALTKAPPCPTGKKTLILGSHQLALQIHESCGHPTELDRALGDEVSLAGGSFLTPDLLGRFRYGSEEVTLVADATCEGGLGTFGWDDEGVAARKYPLVDRGEFVGYLTSRETSPLLRGYSGPVGGAVRAQDWSRLPLIRMVNINLEPGDAGSLEDLIADTKDGILMDANRAWSIDDLRLNFKFGCQVAWEIKKGKRTRLLRNPVYEGRTPSFWASCDAVCGESEWKLWGLPHCGKGEPMQLARVGHGTAPARFRKVRVGSK